MIYKLDEQGKTRINPKIIIERYRAGRAVTIETDEGYDVTKEFLLKQALGSALVRQDILLDFLRMTIDDEVIDDILDAGGLENYLARKRR